MFFMSQLNTDIATLIPTEAWQELGKMMKSESV